MDRLIQVSSPMFLGHERQYVNDCLDRVELTWNGAYGPKFEALFARYCGTKYAVSCSSGTAALHLAMLAHHIGFEDEVLMPALTYVATANAASYCGAKPVFCDIDPRTWCLDPKDVEQKLLSHRNAKAIVAVDLFGMPCDMNRLTDIAEEHNLTLICDAAESIGSTYCGYRTGQLGDASTFSFYGNKILTTGEGGMVTTDSHEVAALLHLYRGQGVSRSRYYHAVVGYNYRMTNLQAALGLAQLEKVDLHLEYRDFVTDTYAECLGKDFVQQQATPGAMSSGWMVAVLVERRDQVMAEMAKHGIETRPFFVPMTQLPPYLAWGLPVTEDVARRGLCLPTHGRLTQDDIAFVCDTLRKVTHAYA